VISFAALGGHNALALTYIRQMFTTFCAVIFVAIVVQPPTIKRAIQLRRDRRTMKNEFFMVCSRRHIQQSLPAPSVPSTIFSTFVAPGAGALPLAACWSTLWVLRSRR
jgi:hypothetical protein